MILLGNINFYSVQHLITSPSTPPTPQSRPALALDERVCRHFDAAKRHLAEAPVLAPFLQLVGRCIGIWDWSSSSSQTTRWIMSSSPHAPCTHLNEITLKWRRHSPSCLTLINKFHNYIYGRQSLLTISSCSRFWAQSIPWRP